MDRTAFSSQQAPTSTPQPPTSTTSPFAIGTAVYRASAKKIPPELARAEEYIADAAKSVLDKAEEITSEAHRRAGVAVERAKERGREVVGRAKELAESFERFLKIEETPHFLIDNVFIRSGYRVYTTYRSCLSSIFKIHNETGNIWTHIIAFAYYLFLFIDCIFVDMLADAHWSDRIAVGVFFLAACKCLLLSVMYHTFSCHLHACALWARADYAGISILIGASVGSLAHFAFYCEPWARLIHISLTTSVGLTGLASSWLPCFNASGEGGRRIRALLFCGMGLSALLPVVHALYLDDGPILVEIVAPYLLGEALTYLLGVALYVGRMPERLAPGFFDTWLHSHQLWHIAVAGGIFWHYQGMLALWRYRTTGSCFP